MPYSSLYAVCSEAIQILNVNSVPESSIINTLARNGISTFQSLRETPIDKISMFRTFGDVRLGIVIKMKELIEHDFGDDSLISGSIRYVYSLLNDVFICHEGIITNKYSRFGIFQSSDGFNTSISMIPGEVYNGVLWLPIKNDEEAKKLFIFHYTNKNEALKRQIALNNKRLQIIGEKE